MSKVQKIIEAAEERLTADDHAALSAAVERVARKQRQFTIDDVWLDSGVAETRGAGGIMQKAARAGLCEKVGYVDKPSARGGRWQVSLWESKVYKARRGKRG